MPLSFARASDVSDSPSSRPRAFMLRWMLLAVGMALAPAQGGLADIFTVRPGQDWSRVAAELKPGDVVQLAAGTHLAATLENVRGTALLPITIRPQEARGLVEIAADREAIKLVNAHHVHIERIAVRKARRAGILVESSPYAHESSQSQGIVLSDIYISNVAGLAEESGIVVRGARDVEISRTRVENCVGAGILLEDCQSVALRRLQCITAPDKNSRAGIDLAGVHNGVVVDDVSIKGPFGTALAIGVRVPTRPPNTASEETPNTAAAEGKSNANPSTDERAPLAPTGEPPAAKIVTPSPLVRLLSATNVRASLVLRFLDVGSCAHSVVRNATVIDPKEEVYRVAKPPLGTTSGSMEFIDSIITWQPGSLRRFGVVVDGADPSGFVLGPNLWWSRELPVALELLGPKDAPFPGTVSGVQRTDLDPQLDRNFAPTASEAKAYGATPAGR